MAISLDEVRRIARLAHLAFGPEEQERFTRQLSAILDHVKMLERLDTKEVEPTAHAGTGAALRDDQIVPPLDEETALENAPEAERGLFKVPRVLG
ncbi:MAG TPA: Asp-tRNA(Asn)/Glu-tRNA(Gln) amidotransferase subunit GatC [Candidatus Polarisedimenticolia bacterium]|nr:Asp-tRNA(Asn)/Glu-tRNA(Gln) amidotransferase subunit GatC [Candidatus Polarisedimenticolia bacterium]